MYHPDAPLLVRIISFLWLFPSMGGLGILVWTYLLLAGEVEQAEFSSVFYVFAYMISTLYLSYGFSHLKQWSLYLFGVLLIYFFIFTKSIFLGPIGLIGFIIALSYYKKFR